MAKDRGAGNMRKFNATRSAGGFILVKDEFKLCEKRKLQFESDCQMAAYLNSVTNIARSTFRRNSTYAGLITDYLRRQPGAALIVDDKTDDPWILKAKLAATQAELGSLQQEVKRLNAKILRVNIPNTDTISSNSSVIDFSNVCVLLALVLTRAETFSINTKDGTLLDLAARPSDQIVANSQRTSSFVHWMKANESLPYVQSVMKC